MSALQPQRARRGARRPHGRGCGRLADRRAHGAARRDDRRLRRRARRAASRPGCGMAAVCMGGLGAVSLAPSEATPRWPWHVRRAELAAGRPRASAANTRAGRCGTRTMPGASSRSAPGRRGRSPGASRSLRSWRIGRLPTAPCWCSNRRRRRRPPSWRRWRATAASRPNGSPILFAPIRSLAGSVQVVARVVEVALHKAHALNFPLERIVDAAGSAPLSPPHPDLATGMGRTNDAIIFGGRCISSSAARRARRRQLAASLPSSDLARLRRAVRRGLQALRRRFLCHRSRCCSARREVAVTALETGATFRAGAISADLLDASFA